ncbi:hypothetical protein PIB30_067299 [Stylosanthes scabra]|uniref:CCHC-type domain-containing protein n=1 Tax=Stylosanthes scabra TaxID=79078 RepID=A0ABU6UPR7_9FABA|nr:hypothetical protein [Stylosanthes scabra]
MGENFDSSALLVNAKTGNSRTKAGNNDGKDRGKGKGGRGSQGRGEKSQKHCTYCGKNGHLEDNRASINMIADESDEELSNQSQKENDGKFESYFTLEQKEALLALLDQKESQ